jgi:dTDP-4-dehydrorhamnose 3,5-epimerase
VILTETPLAGAYLIDPEPVEDERGFFARAWCRRELEALGLETRVAQCSLSYNRRRGTLRGMHYQAAPFEEVKVVRCVRGRIFDAIVDLRAGSPTFGRHFAVELSAEERRALYVPRGCAHGFQALEDASEVYYQISEFHAPDHARGVRWNDPAFGIRWPIPEPVLLGRDAAYPDFDGLPR